MKTRYAALHAEMKKLSHFPDMTQPPICGGHVEISDERTNAGGIVPVQMTRVKCLVDNRSGRLAREV